MKKNHIPPGFPEVLPYIIVRDAGKFLDFLVAVFDAKIIERYYDADGRIVNAAGNVDVWRQEKGPTSHFTAPRKSETRAFSASANPYGTFLGMPVIFGTSRNWNTVKKTAEL